MRFRVLGGGIGLVEPDGKERELRLTPEDTWLTMSLLLDGHLEPRVARRVLGLRDAALRKRMSRLRKVLGLRLPSNAGAYELDPETDIEVDALRLIDLEEQARTDPDHRVDLLREARALWVVGWPDIGTLPAPAPEVQQAAEVARQECDRVGRRLLIVDDRIARDLADHLSVRHDCETADGWRKYEALEHRLTDFDLVVVDRHLTPGYTDGLGLEIVRSIIRRGNAVPVMMMTYRPPGYETLSADQLTYGLADAIPKEKDGKKVDLARLAAKIERVLEEGPVELSCKSIRMYMVSAPDKAVRYIEHKYTGPHRADHLSRMKRSAEKIVTAAEMQDLAAARQELVRFQTSWNPV